MTRAIGAGLLTCLGLFVLVVADGNVVNLIYGSFMIGMAVIVAFAALDSIINKK